jgi:branched-subunit amino acid transport protein
LEADAAGLHGEATLAVSVSQPSLLKLIPVGVLEATGRSLLAGILLGIKTRVGQQLLSDFEQWQRQTP